MTASNIEKQVNQLEIKEEFKKIVSELINAETFNIQRYYNPIIEIYKLQHEQDPRVFVEVSIQIDNIDEEFGVSLFQCRPFIDKSCRAIVRNSSLFLIKSYYIYE